MPACAVLPVAPPTAGFAACIELTFGVAMIDDPGHVPVLLAEALDALAIRPDGVYVDATFGAGGHSRAIAAGLGARGRLLALDRDPAAPAFGADAPRSELVHANFADLEAVLDARGIEDVDGVLFDFGVSSMQLDRPERGFSFRDDGPLDMRMDPSDGPTARDLLETLDERELADLIFRFGEERAARRIARAIVRVRDAGRLPARAGELAALVAGVVHVRGSRERIHPATRTFQALRIAVNGELDAIASGLQAAASRLRPGGRLVAISFHSLEDRIVKHAFRDDPRLHAIVKRPLVASEEERLRNVRARSAKLRVAERLG
jgi:16S rRNA (cytosine1402-N4)-methyltransferase